MGRLLSDGQSPLPTGDGGGGGGGGGGGDGVFMPVGICHHQVSRPSRAPPLEQVNRVV
jgi:hypothetical protein